MMDVNWYPGHMKKTKKMIEDNVKLVDIVVEILDARIPYSSMNPEIGHIIKNKKRLILLNKSDLCDPGALQEWVTHFHVKGVKAIPVNAMSGDGAWRVIKALTVMSQDLVEAMKAKEFGINPIRVMIVGIPNVGKSSLINKLIGTVKAKTGNKPGVTKEKQWISIHKHFDLLDTPGMLWPKKCTQDTGVHLALTGAIKDETFDIESLAYTLIEKMALSYPKILQDVYDIAEVSTETMENIEMIAKRRGCLLKGNRFDLPRTAKLIIQDYRKGVFGTMVLERPSDKKASPV